MVFNIVCLLFSIVGIVGLIIAIEHDEYKILVDDLCLITIGCFTALIAQFLISVLNIIYSLLG